VEVREAPSSAAEARATLATRTPEGTQNLVLVRGRAVDEAGSLWIRIAGPGLPGETDGWVPRRALGEYHAVHTRLVVDLDAYTATLLRFGHVLARFPVGVGDDSSPTPRGEFYVRNRLTRYADDFYGPLAFGTSVRSPYLTDWPDGGFVGIHGTNRPELLPGRVSHGCIRLRNDDILRLARLMPVGTPITIR
jgi:lipoprotein-anchoring transpeptidase ErfK/SrfK